MIIWQCEEDLIQASGSSFQALSHLKELDERYKKMTTKDHLFVLIPFDSSLNTLIYEPKNINFFQFPNHFLDYKSISRTCSFEKKRWIHHVNEYLEHIKQKKLEKVVLCQQEYLKFNEEVNPIFVLSQLPYTKECTGFLFELNEKKTLIGMSPERLFVLNKNELSCDLIAGTRKTSSEFSEKEYAEQGFVRNFMVEKLQGLASSIKISKHSFLTLSYGIHLKQVLKARLNKANISELISLLHPTPAVCGYPQEKALHLIQNVEKSRGYFTGLIGYLRKDKAIFNVIIRSALIEKNQAILCAGAGIVIGSNPEKEWEEIQQKFYPFHSIFK